MLEVKSIFGLFKIENTKQKTEVLDNLNYYFLYNLFFVY